jgi:RNA polymerase sigma-70 factor (ECF subfamily)
MSVRSWDRPEQRRAEFEAAALPFMASLYRAALYLTRRPEDAADLLQDTYLRAYRRFDDFTPGTNCKAWLFTIQHSIFVNKAKKAQREPRGMTIEELEQRYHRWLPPSLLTGFPLSQGQTDTGFSHKLTEVLRELPEAFRSVVVLVDVEELSYEEAGAALGCPVGTVRSRLFRARRLLAAALHAYAEETGYLRGSKKKE